MIYFANSKCMSSMFVPFFSFKFIHHGVHEGEITIVTECLLKENPVYYIYSLLTITHIEKHVLNFKFTPCTLSSGS